MNMDREIERAAVWSTLMRSIAMLGYLGEEVAIAHVRAALASLEGKFEKGR